MVANIGNAVGNGNTGQTGAAPESIESNAGNAVRNGNTGQSLAAIECIIANADDTARNGNAGQLVAAIESSIANANNKLTLLFMVFFLLFVRCAKTLVFIKRIIEAL